MTMQPERPIFSVSEISQSLKSYVEQCFPDISVRGEVSGIKKVASGHTYFSLKDADSVLSAICWRGRDASTTAALQEGLEVICRGRLSTYPGRSSYQMIVETAEPAGVGALLKLLQERKERLEKEGLFDPSRRKKIPFLPDVIGVITSPTGAVIRDILHRLSDRFPRPVILWPVLVQGDTAAQQIIQAIQGFNEFPLPLSQSSQEPPPEQAAALSQPSPASKKHPRQSARASSSSPSDSSAFLPRPDVLIIARGGGSLEDLWCFNDEALVRAVAASEIPIISAVGHETDTTLIDFVADLRAPTPTGAAEKAVPVRQELMATLAAQENRLTQGLIRYLSENKTKLDSLARAFPRLSGVLETLNQRVDEAGERLNLAILTYQNRCASEFKYLINLLKSYSYTAVLERGFALATTAAHQIVSSAAAARQQSLLTLVFSDGKTDVIPLKDKIKTADKAADNLPLFASLTGEAHDKK